MAEEFLLFSFYVLYAVLEVTAEMEGAINALEKLFGYSLPS